MLSGRGAFAPHSSEAAALRGLGAGPSALNRVAAALLLRQVLGGVMSPASIEVALHGLLLPALHMQVGGAGTADLPLQFLQSVAALPCMLLSAGAAHAGGRDREKV